MHTVAHAKITHAHTVESWSVRFEQLFPFSQHKEVPLDFTTGLTPPKTSPQQPRVRDETVTEVDKVIQYLVVFPRSVL